MNRGTWRIATGAALAGSVLVPWLRDQATLAVGRPSTGSDPTRKAERVNLYTPAGIVQAITAFEQAAGTTEFSEFSVFEDHAVVRIPVKGSTNAVEDYVYQYGDAKPWDATTAPLPVPADLRGQFESFIWSSMRLGCGFDSMW